MEQYPFGDESAVHLEMHLPGFSESPGLVCGEALRDDLCLSARDATYVGLSGSDAAPAATGGDALEADLNALALYPPKDCGSLELLDEPDSRHEPGLPTPEEAGGGGGGGGRSAGRGKRPLGSPGTSPPGCSRCGKVFGSASALSKHCLTHSQKREHVCGVCGKAFKRQDHLSGHMLTHQKIKPFACPERDCEKSYCDHRSLRRHYELQHGLGGSREAPKEGAAEESPLLPAPSIRGSGKPADRPTACSQSGSFPPKRDLPRCVVKSFANRQLPLAALPSAWTDSAPASQASRLAPNGSGLAEPAGDSVRKDRLSSQRSAASSDVCALINPGNAPVIAPGENGVTELPGGCFISEPTGLQGCPDGALPPFPLFGGQKAPADQPGGNFQWMRNAPVCAKPRRNSVCLAREPPAAAQGVSEGLAGPSRAFSAAYACPDAFSFPVAPFKAEEDALSESALGYFEETFQSARPPDSHPWENAGELSFPEIPKRGALQSETGPLFPKPQDPAACPEPLRGQQHLFQAITESPQAPSRARALAPSPPVAPEGLAANPLRAPQPPADNGPSASLQTSVPPFPALPPDGEKPGPRAAPAFQSPVTEHAGLRDASAPGHPRCAVHGNRSPGRSPRLENTSPAVKKEKSRDGSREAGGKAPAGAGRSWRLPAVRRERLTLGLSCAAPPSQVALASFPPAPAGTRRLTIFNRIQGGNIYSLTSAAREESSSAGGSSEAGAAPAAGGSSESGVPRKNCGRLVCTENGPESRAPFRGEQWRSPQRKEEQQVCRAGDASARKPSPEAVGDGSCPAKPPVPSEAGTLAPLVIPVSVPVTAATSQAGNQVTEKESPGGTALGESSHQRKRKRQTRPKSLFIPPPPAPDAQPGLGGCYQSHLRSPVFLVDHLLRDLFHSSPYTPPPMLSPVREGSGLYFSTLCSSSATGDPNRLFSAVLGRKDGDFGFCLMKDNAKIGVRPHINVGSRFQAEVPNLRARSPLEKDEQAAALVWKPWGDIATNPETQDRVTELLNMACSSAMPGGGTNLELALHCLHEARGNVLEALEMLLFGGHRRSEAHPLANYRYAGSDAWTPLEKQLFKKAFCVHKKDFYLIQKKIQTKNVSQCVEYYYIWKKKIKFDYSRAQVIEKKVKRDKDEVEETEEKSARSPKKRHRLMPPGSGKMKRKSGAEMPRGEEMPRGVDGPSLPLSEASAGDRRVFPCRECKRVFDKIKGRNAHMKSHRLQEQLEPLARVKWPLKPFKSEAQAEGTQMLTSPAGNRETAISEQRRGEFSLFGKIPRPFLAPGRWLSSGED